MVKNWVKRLLPQADVRKPRTLYYLLDRPLGSGGVPPGPCILVLAMPAEDGAWLDARPAEFRQAYLKGLEAYVAFRKPEAAGIPLEMRSGQSWRAFWEPVERRETDLSSGPESHGVTGYVVWPDPEEPRWIAWRRPAAPRVPGPAEGREAIGRLEGVLEGLAEPGGVRWRPWARHALCGRICWFVPVEETER